MCEKIRAANLEHLVFGLRDLISNVVGVPTAWFERLRVSSNFGVFISD